MKATKKQIEQAKHFLSAISMFIDIKEKRYYMPHIHLLWQALAEVEIDNEKTI
jgi:hypothetical protein